MRVDLYGLSFEAPMVSVYVWSPWRASALEHKLYEGLRKLAGMEEERGPDEWRLDADDPKAWKQAVQTMERILKGWQEEGRDGASDDRRSWRWVLEADVDSSGYDHNGDPGKVWLFVRLGLERGSPGEDDAPEEIDLDWFGVGVHGTRG